MPSFCLIPSVAEKFKQDIISGKVNPEKLSEMTSKERHAFFVESLGEGNAAPLNALFESKLLLKNKQAGMVSWAKKVLGENTPAGKDIISKIERMDKILSPSEEKAFLEDLASQKLGTHITYDEASKITDLSKKIEETKAALDKGGDRMEYGRAVVNLQNYVADLKGEANKFSLAELRNTPGKAFVKGVSEVAGNAKAIKASMDNSAIFRQGWKTLLTNPNTWQKNARQSFVDLVKTFGKDEVMKEVHADIVSRPNYDLMKKAKLDVGVTEEAFPTALPEKIPFLGRVYKASENAFTAFVQRTRADVFDKYIDIAKKTGVELSDNELQSIGKMVNSLTGRGSLGKAEPIAGVVNNVFFSPRALKAHVDTLIQPLTGAGGSSFVRKQAAINLLKIVGGTAAILGTAKALKPGSVEFDPRSADFGKIRIKDTRFDVTGGMASLITVVSRLLTLSSKSSTTGKITPLNASDKNGNLAYGAKTGLDVLVDFSENKLSPAAAVLKDLWLEGHDFEGKKPSVLGEAKNLFVPLPVTTYLELKNNPNSANILLSMIADALGISTNTYSPKPKK